MKKEIFESLAKLSSRAPTDSNIPSQSPAVEISGELAFCLDTLMNEVGTKINLAPGVVFEKILNIGIDNWLDSLPENTKKSIGLAKERIVAPKPAKVEHTDADFDDDPDPAHAQQAAYAQMTEHYGYTPLTAHGVKPGNGRGDSRTSSNGRKTAKKKNGRGAGKNNPTQRGGSRRRKFAAQKNHSTSQ